MTMECDAKYLQSECGKSFRNGNVNAMKGPCDCRKTYIININMGWPLRGGQAVYVYLYTSPLPLPLPFLPSSSSPFLPLRRKSHTARNPQCPGQAFLLPVFSGYKQEITLLTRRSRSLCFVRTCFHVCYTLLTQDQPWVPYWVQLDKTAAGIPYDPLRQDFDSR